ncbi:MAG TPA: extracellular solute-binding protein [Candidatus Lumbricidophila sp.]|nr:extracellular solute-binding protein [Candidatus Lumbricidophila sp.]
MYRKITMAAAVTAVAALALAGCSGTSTTTPSATLDNSPVKLTMSAWNLAATPTNEFKALADAFTAEHPNVTIELKDYDAAKYPTLVTADLAAGTATDLITIKTVVDVVPWAEGGQLADVSDVKIGDGVKGGASYNVDGKQYAIPYRLDGNVIYYNKDLFKAAGVADPDGTWTWDDYVAAAEKLKTGLAAAGSKALPAYQHGWNTLTQNFATVQTGNDVLKGDFSYMKPYYERTLKMQADGLQLPLATVTANKTTYQAQFGKQSAAMEIMGTWYVSTLVAQQAKGDADKFAWGIAPAPQKDAAATKAPVTFGDPTGIAINAKLEGNKLAAAKAFLAFIESEKGASKLAAMAITPAFINDAVTAAYFGLAGVPTDDLSKKAWSGQKILPQNLPNAKQPVANTALVAMHSAILTGSGDIDKAIADAQAQFKNSAG